MSWAKVDDALHSHTKARKAGLPAMGLWVMCLSHCASHLTDGFVDDINIEVIGGATGRELADRLVTAGLWIREEGGYRFHDYLKHNPSADEINETRRQARERRKRKPSAEAQSPPPSTRDRRSEVSMRSHDVRANVDDTPENVDARSLNVRDTFGPLHTTPTRPDPTYTEKIPPTPRSGSVAPPDLDRPGFGGSASPAREELPPVAPVSAQQSRDLRAPTQVQAVLAKAYGDGVRKAAPDVPFPDPSEPKDLRELETMAIAKWKSALIVEAQMWVEKSAYAYRIAMADRAQYESGFSPTAWAKWVKGGGLTQAGATNAPPQSGQGRFQPVDQSLSPHHPSRRPYKPIVVENDDPTVPIPFPGLTPRPAAVKPKAPAS